MKTRFSTLDILCMGKELQCLIGMRVVQVYDVDHKTYLIKLQRSEEKKVILIESGIRFHLTQYDWPKNIAPSGFCMKLRKHLKNKRLEQLTQIGLDRIVDLQFGSGEYANHIILELFDRGNIVLTDEKYITLNILRPHTEGDKFKFAVREQYPLNRARLVVCPPKEDLLQIITKAKDDTSLKKILLPCIEYGPSLLEHVFCMAGLSKNPIKGKDFKMDQFDDLAESFKSAAEIFQLAFKGQHNGYIIQKRVERVEQEDLLKNEEFHPFHFIQHKDSLYKTFDTFSMAVDEFFSSLESQKHELKANQLTREAMKKVDRIREDQTLRVQELDVKQDTDRTRAELITRNYENVDAAIRAIRSAIAAQLSWSDIQNLVDEANRKNDPVAGMIRKLKLETNHISLHLSDPCAESSDDECLPSMIVDIDLDYSAHANAKRYYVDKKSAAIKQQKTIESQEKALKSAHKKALQVIKQVKMMTTISKSRKTYWFEKFFWFISSENYLVIGGHDQQQNEIIVKRYMKPGDVYVHADVSGASSIVIKNPSGKPIPPKTLSEAGTMAICYSVGWAAKVVCSAWWVNSDQVSKAAPSGEYLTTGSFMIRGKKNFLPPAQLAMGFAFMFRLEESSAERHKDERSVRSAEDIGFADEADGIILQDEELELNQDEDSSENTDSEENQNNFPNSSLKLTYSSNDIGLKIKRKDVIDKKGENDEEEKKILETVNVGVDSVIPANQLNRPKKVERKQKEDEELKLNQDEDSSENTDSEENQDNFPESSVKLTYSPNETGPKIKGKDVINEKGEDDEEEKNILETVNLDVDSVIPANQLNRPKKVETKQKEVFTDEELELNQDEDSSENTDSEENQNNFPNSSLKLTYSSNDIGLKIKRKDVIDKKGENDEEEKNTLETVNLGVDSIIRANQLNRPKKVERKQKEVSAKEESQERKNSGKEQCGFKRGQKSKLKKIKEKYKDQDEEEKQLRMSILQSAGTKKNPRKKKTGSTEPKKSGQKLPVKVNPNKKRPLETLLDEIEEGDNDENEEFVRDLVSTDLDMLSLLTGQPHPEDELLFAIPVVGPYSTFHNYKYKMKLIPGNGKRGKSAQTCVEVFSRAKECIQREKDLMRSVNTDVLSRNFPGKVKLSVPQAARKKK